MSARTTLRLLLLASALTAAACGDDAPADGVFDDLGFDAELNDADVGIADADDTADAAPDTTPDAALDAADTDDALDATDASDADVGDAPSDAAPDTTPDAGPDATPDAGPDGTPDAGPDGTPDAGGPDDGAVPIEFAPTSIAVDASFSIGVQSGAMYSDGFLAWTFMSTRSAVALRVWRPGEAPGEVLLAHESVVEPNADGYLHAPVDGLAAGTWYSYAFFVRDGEGRLTGRSPIGRVRTALAPGVSEPLTIAVTSCTRQQYAPYEALSAMARENPDLFLHTGDQSYNDDAETLAAYRAAWFDTLGDTGYRDIHQATGFYSTWDDHEVTDNWDPERISPTRLAAAWQAYLEALAVESDAEQRLWRSYPWGDTAEVFVVDSRSERQPSTRGRDDVYISRAQMDWLKASLAASPAHFKLVLNSVPITDMPTLYVGNDDRWEGYGGQRSELLDWITDEDIRNVWFLSGDFHIGMVTRVNNEGPARRIIEIAAGPGGNSNPAASALGSLEALAGVDQILFHTRSTQTEVATMLHLDPATDSIRVRFYEANGNVLYDEVLSEGD